MAMTEKRMIRVINNLQKLADKSDSHPYVGLVMFYNNYLFATDSFILHKIEVSGLPYMTFGNQKPDRWYRVYIEDDRIKITDDDIQINKMNSGLAAQMLEMFNNLLSFESVEAGNYINPVFLKRALEPYNIAQVSMLIKTVDKMRIFLSGHNEYLQLHTIIMGIRR